MQVHAILIHGRVTGTEEMTREYYYFVVEKILKNLTEKKGNTVVVLKK